LGRCATPGSGPPAAPRCPGGNAGWWNPATRTPLLIRRKTRCRPPLACDCRGHSAACHKFDETPARQAVRDRSRRPLGHRFHASSPLGIGMFLAVSPRHERPFRRAPGVPRRLERP
jgi:hypothetical protein